MGVSNTRIGRWCCGVVAAFRGGWFDRLAAWAARFSGRPVTFMLACLLIVAWLVTGPIFGFSDTWQLVINTATTIVTFLMVFLIQSTQNRDTAAMHIKIDEVIRATAGAHNALLDLEELSEEELRIFHARYERLAALARARLKAGGSDIDTPEVTAAIKKGDEKAASATTRGRRKRRRR